MIVGREKQMTTTEMGWTKPLAVARSYIDPSGVQSASTTFQALLFPGMSTQTTRLRYIPLIAAARYYRMEAGKGAEDQLSLTNYLRRFEALIAVRSIRHHPQERILDGIVGRGAGLSMSGQEEFELKTSLQNPPYNIYRGTLYNLGILDTSTTSDPLFNQAKSLAMAWDISAANAIGEDMRKGILPSRMRRDTVDEIAPAFCLCKIPEGSVEQQALMQNLFALGKELQLPSSYENEDALVLHSQACRSLAWRFLLELVLDSDNKRLSAQYTLVYLLSHDFVPPTEHPTLQFCLQTWRWIAARTFFERGWTQIFAQILQVLRQEREGLSRKELQQKAQEDYLTENQDEPITRLIQEVEAKCNSPEWLLERFDGKLYRDFLLCIYIGLFMAVEDKKRYGTPILENLWEREPVPFSREYTRFEKGIRNNNRTSTLWAEIGEESLTQHFQIALRKMSFGNPDTLLVDFDNGQWRVPEKAQDEYPRRAEGSTRLDIGLQWAQQLGLIETTGQGGFALTEVGLHCCVEWDREHRQ